LEHVYWLGGGSGAGKTTVARRIARETGFTLYATDDAMSEHFRRAEPSDAPRLAQFHAMDMDERWVTRSPQVMLDTFPWFLGEGFNLILEDLSHASSDTRIIVEGFRVLPNLVAPLLTDDGHAVWLLPTPDFRRAAVEHRQSGWEFLERTTDPTRARRNLFERDALFTDRLRNECRQLNLHVIEVDGNVTEDELTACVMRRFAL
jgi:2-phosphoglycerate kinase